MDDAIGVSAVIGDHVVGDRCVRLELVCNGIFGTHSRSFTDVGAVRVEPEPVELSQTGASVEWGRSVICIEPEDWLREGGRQGISGIEVRQTETYHTHSTD